MKKVSNLLLALLMAVPFVMMTSCGGDEPIEDAIEDVVEDVEQG